MVARIAEDKLQEINPKAFAYYERLLFNSKQDVGEFGTQEGDYPFTESAVLADIGKSGKYRFQSPWHFIDNKFEDGFNERLVESPISGDDSAPPAVIGDILEALEAMQKILETNQTTNLCSS